MSILCRAQTPPTLRPVELTTPQPMYVEPTPPVPLALQQPRMDHHERMRMRAAAFRATRLHPGPVGELVSRELLTWEEFGYRLDRDGLVQRLAHHILNTPLESTS